MGRVIQASRANVRILSQLCQRQARVAVTSPVVSAKPGVAIPTRTPHPVGMEVAYTPRKGMLRTAPGASFSSLRVLLRAPRLFWRILSTLTDFVYQLAMSSMHGGRACRHFTRARSLVFEDPQETLRSTLPMTMAISRKTLFRLLYTSIKARKFRLRRLLKTHAQVSVLLGISSHVRRYERPPFL